ncbi:MAG: hypothetical protein OXI16_14715 [Chloroflexota bacterium]|nr:hypothetical protein [Chloroflexota bacterium]
MTTQRPPSKKKQVLTRLYSLCKSRQDFVFTNDEVKAVCGEIDFKNPFDATKIDTSTGLPDALLEDDAFVVHLGRGAHQFVFGIENGYHRFEPVPDNRRFQWNYRRSMLNNINTSESNILSVGYNQRIIHDFLYEDIAASPKVYGSNRTHIPVDYYIGGDEIRISRVQVEIDYTVEHLGEITIFEAKNGEPDDFNVFQLFNPFRYYLRATENLSVTGIQCCYLVRPESDKLRLYLYGFADPKNPGSIELIRNAEYMLVER